MPHANSGPLPPNANSANSRTSRPRSVETALMARIMLDAAIWCAPYAARSIGMLQRTRDRLLENGAGLLGVQLQRTADQVFRIEIPEQHVCVGHRRHRPAEIVADRAGLRAGALGADLQAAAGIDPHERPASRADLRQIDRRHLQRVAGAREQARADHDPGAYGVLRGARHFAAFDDRCLGGGAAHVERDDVGQLLGARQRLRAHHAARRPRLDDVHRALDRRGVRGQSAARLHQQQAGGDPGLVQTLAQRTQIARHHRHDIRVHHRGGRALVLLDLRQHLAREADRQARRALRDDVADRQLVNRVGVGVQQAHGDGFDPLGRAARPRRGRRLACRAGAGRCPAHRRARPPPAGGGAPPAAPVWSR